jgi:hypothetical protein
VSGVSGSYFRLPELVPLRVGEFDPDPDAGNSDSMMPGVDLVYEFLPAGASTRPL